MTELQISTSLAPWTPAAMPKTKGRLADMHHVWRDEV